MENVFEQAFDKESDGREVLLEKLRDAGLPGSVIEFDPDEAAQVGAFEEDALSEEDAAESAMDIEALRNE